MPPVIGPRTCANSGCESNTAAASRSGNAATIIELVKTLLLRTAFSFSG
jgi:hypothetical protein